MLIVRRKLQEQVTQQRTTTPTLVAGRRPVLAGSAADLHAQKERVKREIEKHLKLISDAHQQIDNAQVIVDNAHKVIEAQLRLVNLTSHSNGVYVAAMVEVYSRQSRTIDPKKFKAHVGDDVFWGSIKVSVESASAHLTDKELAAVSDIKAGRLTGVQLKIGRKQAGK